MFSVNFLNGASPTGTANDQPLSGYYDADNKADVAVRTPANGWWLARVHRKPVSQQRRPDRCIGRYPGGRRLRWRRDGRPDDVSRSGWIVDDCEIDLRLHELVRRLMGCQWRCSAAETSLMLTSVH